MRKSLVLGVLVVALSAIPAHAGGSRKEAQAQVQFGIDVAQKGLWKEALYRWEKAVEIDPTYAAAFNDLAVAYEHQGLFDKARQAYTKALALEPNNVSIKQNFDYFKEINDRASRRTTR
jgi:Tfp pilus assembly protein PilF